MSQHPVEALLRPPVELYSTVAALSAAGLAVLAPSAFLMTPAVADAAAGMLVMFGLWRGAQGWRVLAYQRGLRRLLSYVLAAEAIPVSRDWLFLGKGFRWTQRHTQRLWDLTRPGTERYLEPGMLYRWARRLEDAWPWSARLLSHRCSPLKPLPPLGGLPALHGIGMPEGESDLRLPATERQGHIFVDGTTGVGKSALAELLITQDIRRGDTVIVFDPKGSANLFRRLYAEARRTRREFLFFHLGYPDRSARYNPIGRFERITEVATRLAGQLPNAGNAAAFREFAWLFVNVIARALVALGQKPDYRTILRYMANIEQLLVRYFEHWLEKEGGAGWREAVQQGGTFDRPGPGHLKGRDRRALALVRYYRKSGLYDVVADGLRRAFELETSYFQKISVAAQPLLEKLLSGPVAGLINPDYGDPQDRRPILDFQKAIRTRAVVYIGLDALTDPEVAAVVGQSMLATWSRWADRCTSTARATVCRVRCRRASFRYTWTSSPSWCGERRSSRPSTSSVTSDFASPSTPRPWRTWRRAWGAARWPSRSSATAPTH